MKIKLALAGTRKNGAPEGSLRSKLARKRLLPRLARRRHPSRVSLARARSLFRPHYLQAPATQATNFAHPLFFISPGYYSRPKKNWKQYLFGHRQLKKEPVEPV